MFVETPQIPQAELVAIEPKPEIPAEIAVTHDSTMTGNGVDELRYLFITSAVELVESNAVIQELPYSYQSPELAIGVVKADGGKVRSLLELLYSRRRVDRTSANLRTLRFSSRRQILT